MVNAKGVERVEAEKTKSLVITYGPSVSTTAKGISEYSAEIVTTKSRELYPHTHSALKRGTKPSTVASLRHEKWGVFERVHPTLIKSYPHHYCIDKKNVILIS